MKNRNSRLLILLLWLFVYSPAAKAHAILLAAQPAPGQVVDGPKVEVKLRFNSRIDLERSRITLVSEAGQRPLMLDRQAAPDSLSCQATRLTPGSYLLRWQVLATDGHITRGEVRFRVR